MSFNEEGFSRTRKRKDWPSNRGILNEQWRGGRESDVGRRKRRDKRDQSRSGPGDRLQASRIRFMFCRVIEGRGGGRGADSLKRLGRRGGWKNLRTPTENGGTGNRK